MTSLKTANRHEAQRAAATANFIAHKIEIDRLLAVIVSTAEQIPASVAE